MKIYKINFGRVHLISFAFLATLLYALVAPIAQASEKSERGREILEQARAALGGAAALKSIQSLSASGDFRSGSGDAQAGDVQLDLLLPDKLMRVKKWSPVQDMKVTSVETMDGSRVWTDSQEKNSRPILGSMPAGIGGMGGGGGRGGGMGRGGRRSGGGGGSGGNPTGGNIKIAPSVWDSADSRQISSDFTCLILGLLLHVPDSSQVDLALENNDYIEGVTADYLKIDFGNGFIAHLAVDQKTHRPVMVSYEIPSTGNEAKKEPDSSTPELTKIQIYFSEYKQVEEKKFGNIWLPHQFTKTRNGLTVEDMHIKKFQLNPHLKPKQFEQKHS